jgi:hypothetical protein
MTINVLLPLFTHIVKDKDEGRSLPFPWFSKYFEIFFTADVYHCVLLVPKMTWKKGNSLDFKV